MWILLGVILAFIYGLCGFQWWHLARPERLLPRLDAIAKDTDLSLDAATAPLVIARLVRRERVAAAGLALIFTLYLFVAVYLDAHRAHVAKPSTLPLAYVAPIAIGLVGRPFVLTCLMAYDAVRGRGTDGSRVARVVVPTLADYIKPAEVWLGRVMAGLVLPGTALTVGLAQSHHRGERLSTVGLSATAALGVVGLVFVEVISRRLVSLGQPAGSPMELAWDDALRSMQLRELYLLLILFSLMLSVFTFAVLNTPVIAVFAVAIPAIGFCAAGKPGSHFRRRLWPWPTDEVPA